MKRLSLKWRLTILYTVFMIILTGSMLGVLFSLSSSEILASVELELEEKVFDAFDDIQYRDGYLDIDSDMQEVENGIYLSVYDEQGDIQGGRIPYDFTEKIELSEGLHKLSIGGNNWYVLDAETELEGYGNVFVRGITSVTAAESSLKITLHLSIIIFPIMVLLMAGLGHAFICRALRPVSKITATAREIYEKEDLSKRIGLKDGKDEIYRLGEMIDLMLERLESTFEREKQFTSDVSHELRTPVTVILTQCEYLLEDTNLSGEEKISVEAIQRKAQNMARMISQLLFLSRADQNRQIVQKEWLDLSILTEIAVEEQKEIAAQRGIKIETEIQKDVHGYVDETLFIRVWMNLIGNAIAYGREKGWIKVGISKEDGMIVGYIQDNGIGIEKENLVHIWERFYQVDDARTKKENSGSGLGLSMVKWIIEVHGGTISVESEYGRGSRFEFSVPEKN